MKKRWEMIKDIFQYFNQDKKIIFLAFFLSIISVSIMILCSFLVGQTINIFSSEMNPNKFRNLIINSSIICSLYFLYWLLSSRVLIWTIKISHSCGSRIRQSVFEKLLSVPISYIDKNKVGELLTKATNDIDILIVNMVQIIVSAFMTPIYIVATTIIILIMSPTLALISIVIILLIFWILYTISKKSAKNFTIMQNKIAEMNGLNKEFITNKIAIYIFQRQKLISDKYLKTNSEHEINSFKAEHRIGLIYPILDVLENIFYGVIYILGFIFIISDVPNFGIIDLNIGTLATFVIMVRIVNSEAGNIARFFSMFEKMFVCIERILDILKEKNDVDEGTIERTELKGKIEFKNVNFSYVPNNPIIKNFDLAIEEGQTVAIVGPTGSGKTTLINLLMRFYEIDSGEILIDDVNIQELKKENLRKFISIVLQDTHLFSESIYRNIAYGDHKNEINYERVVESAKIIGSDHFINLLEDGYETVLKNSENISIGEAQLLALTRSYYSPSNILILDEATSSIDSKTEHDVQQGLAKILESKTTIVIAHRLSTIINSDLIVVMKDGKILEKGKHKELIDKKGFYYELYTTHSLETEDI